MQIDQKILQEQLAYPIKTVLALDATLVVILSYDAIPSNNEEILNRNIYAFNMDGTLKWQIQAVQGGTEREKPFLSIKVIEGKLIAYNWLGMDYIVDLNDGSLHMHGQPRRPW
jgi:outer membrane protein assembly factor BamB